MSSNNAGGFALNLMKRVSDQLTCLIPSSILPSSSSSAPEPDAAFEDLRRLERTMKRIQTIVSDAEQRCVKGQAEKLRLEELKEVAYEADNVVDEYGYEVLSAKIKSGIQLGGDNGKRKRGDEVCQVVPVPSELAIRVKMVRERFDEIIREWEALHWSETENIGQYNLDKVTLPQTSSLVHETSIHGRGDEKENIIRTFILGNINDSLSVLPLVGMGGIGKTTLAQLIYNDARVCEYFQLRAWVCVSEDFSVNLLTRNIIVSFTNCECDFTELDNLQRTLMEIVKGKRFLIVLDDVWNEKPSLWCLLKAPLTNIGFGKIIVTTRNKEVAQNMQTLPLHFLTYLSFEYCWSIFKQFAFERHDPNINPGLVEIGREIVKKCGGLPLAVKAIGSLLRFEGTEEKWREILDSEIWELSMRNDDIFPALKISYDRLPIHLKRCFVFLSLFPKDHVILEDEIIRLWFKLDLLDSRGRILEDIGVDYVTELMQRSMLQLYVNKDRDFFTKLMQKPMSHLWDNEDIDSVSPKRVTGRCFIMHDLVNDLAQFVSGKDCARINHNRLHEIQCGVRFLSIVSDHPTDIIDMQYMNNHKEVRLLQFIQTTNSIYSYSSTSLHIAKIPLQLFEMMRHLRALDFTNCIISILPESIGNLKQLRYLNLSNTMVNKLPDSICGLYNLHTLELNGSHIMELPIKIGCLVNLRHLVLNKFTCIPSGIGQLINLKILPFFSVKPGTWHCALSKLKNLVNLENQLFITSLEHVTSVKEVDDILCNKRYLKSLVLSWKPELFNERSCNHSNHQLHESANFEELLGTLRPHTNIVELHILRYPGSSFPRWLGDASFSKLTKIYLSGGSISSKSLPTLGHLPSLRDVDIRNLRTLKNVGREFCSYDSNVVCFRALNTLGFSDMDQWENWSGVEKNDFSILQTLKLISCMKLKLIPEPLYYSLCTLDLTNCETLMTPRLLPSLNCLKMTARISKMFLDGLYLPLLKTLKLACVQSITSLVLTSQHLPSIEAIEIIFCRMLRTIVGLSSLSSLKKLELHTCQNLQLASDECLPHEVQRLVIYECPQLHEWYQFQNNRGLRMEASFR